MTINLEMLIEGRGHQWITPKLNDYVNFSDLSDSPKSTRNPPSLLTVACFFFSLCTLSSMYIESSLVLFCITEYE